MTSRIEASPAEAVAEIERALRNAPPPQADTVAVIQHQLAQFGAAAAAETVIESYYGCLVTEHVRRVFAIDPDTLPLIINSSHRAVRRVCVLPGEHLHSKVLRESWASGWQALRKRHIGVDMHVRTAQRERSLRHADLYVIAAGQIVSLENQVRRTRRAEKPGGVRHPDAPLSRRSRRYSAHHLLRVPRLQHLCAASTS